ncbi:uncharacterized protein EI90DRAFT_3018489 [Cantharellus anzutake]|uniref:uncharacterized protein n=1 Tax=Cantharellus anzutake TaxID=1750568 RepID=UPI0019055332|nr:uncharacterized protein EI90DRAFT_3018489 [Cantharellus anzutake]KAF8326891.1 hypothetical protein EI90DRAFT_3018489 [Cantharellus anzutake]
MIMFPRAAKKRKEANKARAQALLANAQRRKAATNQRSRPDRNEVEEDPDTLRLRSRMQRAMEEADLEAEISDDASEFATPADGPLNLSERSGHPNPVAEFIDAYGEGDEDGEASHMKILKVWTTCKLPDSVFAEAAAERTRLITERGGMNNWSVAEPPAESKISEDHSDSRIVRTLPNTLLLDPAPAAESVKKLLETANQPRPRAFNGKQLISRRQNEAPLFAPHRVSQSWIGDESSAQLSWPAVRL